MCHCVQFLRYLGVQAAFDGRVDPVETAAFAVAFTAVYTAFAWVRYARAAG